MINELSSLLIFYTKMINLLSYTIEISCYGVNVYHVGEWNISIFLEYKIKYLFRENN